MPDSPPSKRRPELHAAQTAAAEGLRYAELHCKTNFSFLEGASHPDELVQQAALLGYGALAITDRNSLAGVVRAHVAAKEIGLKLLIGAEITPTDAPPLVLLATERAAYSRLSRLITLGRRRAPKGECELTMADVVEHAEGLIACMKDCGLWGNCGVRSAECGVQMHSSHFSIRNPKSAIRNLSDCYLLAELHRGPDDWRQLAGYVQRSRELGIPLVAAGDVHYHVPQRRALHDVLTAIRHGCTVAEAGEQLFPNAERHLRSRAEIAALFAAAPDAIRRTLEIVDRCTFSLDELRYEYPEELCPEGLEPLEYLTRLAWEGARERYPDGIPDKVRGLVEHELQLIADLRYEAYFLTVWDLVRFARSRDILCQGRGSAANSAVCYCLGVTSVDPEQIDVLFERFVSRERNEAPDIDVDFEHERREEVLQYLYEKYGRDRAGLTAEVITYRPRSAIRDVGKALGLSLAQVDVLAKNIDGYHHEPHLMARCDEAGLAPDSPLGLRLTTLVEQLLGFPRHLSQHVGGMVITRGLLCELVPIENAAMPERTVIEWDKDDLDALGLLKVDCLALGMLTAIRKCFDFVAAQEGCELTLANVPQEDPAVYEMISRADTLGVFQIESRAQMSMLPRLQPRTFYDLVIEVAIVRPGPIQGDMVHPYLRRRAGAEPVEYPNDTIREVLEKTLGVPIFQEQAMRLAVVAAGFTPGEADQLRRAMGAWRRSGVIEQFQQKLLLGMTSRGLSSEYAQRVFQQISGFGEYGFPESHSASFARLVYVSAWLKHYYPAAFTAALLNSQPMGFYAPAQLVRDAREHGVEVRPADVNWSGWDSRLELRTAECGVLEMRIADCGLRNDKRGPPQSALRTPHSAIRLGLRLVSGLAESQGAAIEKARQAGPFHSVRDLARRTRLGRAVLMRLAKADALSSLETDRHGALWHALGQSPDEDLPLLDALDACDLDEELPAAVPHLSAFEEVLADYRTAGLSLRAHPMSFFRAELDPLRVVRACDLSKAPVGRWIRVAGIVLVRQRPSTASGITFVTLEDETGVANLIVRQDVWNRFRRVAHQASAMLATGRLERQGQVIHILAAKLEDLVVLSDHLSSRSRDFR